MTVERSDKTELLPLLSRQRLKYHDLVDFSVVVSAFYFSLHTSLSKQVSRLFVCVRLRMGVFAHVLVHACVHVCFHRAYHFSKAVLLLRFLTVTCSCCPYLAFGSHILVNFR